MSLYVFFILFIFSLYEYQVHLDVRVDRRIHPRIGQKGRGVAREIQGRSLIPTWKR